MFDALYTAPEVSRIAEIPRAILRVLVQARLLDPKRGPDGDWRFAFRDLVVLRQVGRLLKARVPRGRIINALLKARCHVPPYVPLSGIQLLQDGRELRIQDEDGWFDPESGQAAFDFSPRADAGEVARVRAEQGHLRPVPKEVQLGAEEWFQLGCHLEEADFAQARDAYRRVLELDPEHTFARINLGRMLAEAGDVEPALIHLRLAMDTDRQEASPAFHLGVILERSGRLEDALGAYAEAIERDQRYSEAYLNMVDLYERLGQPELAVKTMAKYRRVTQEG
jgi:tetratricopeptide (TPR) repeat protein